MKATAVAPSNIAFIKYWGKRNELLRIPTNGSISMNLNNLTTATTVEFSESLKKDYVEIDGKKMATEINRVTNHLDRIRKIAKIQSYAKVVSKNSFPAATGLSSSASGFAALTVASSVAAGLSLSEGELSILARLGSGSACRSIPDGFVEWIAGESHQTSYARSLHPADYWDIVDVITVVSTQRKQTSTTLGQKLVKENQFFKTRLLGIDKKIHLLKEALRKKDFMTFGKLIEQETMELHSIMLTSNPYLLYLLPQTLDLILKIRQWREEGLLVYFSISTGHNVHLILQGKDVDQVTAKLGQLPFVIKSYVNRPSKGTKIVQKHLF